MTELNFQPLPTGARDLTDHETNDIRGAFWQVVAGGIIIGIVVHEYGRWRGAGSAAFQNVCEP